MDQVKRAILMKLLRHGAFGSNHYRIDTFLRMGWKAHERGQVKDRLEELMRQGFVQWYNKSKKAIQLSREGLEEASRLLGGEHD